MTPIPHAGAIAGLVIGVAIRVLMARDPNLDPRARGALSAIGLAGLAAGGVVAVASGNPAALLAANPVAVAQCLIDVAATAGAMLAPFIGKSAPKE